MNKSKYLEDLNDIKNIMSRSSNFKSLSGLSGVSTGIIALLGVLFANELVFKNQQYFTYTSIQMSTQEMIYLLGIAVGTLFLSIFCAIYFTYKKTKTKSDKVWNSQTKQLLINLLIPMISGGILCLLLLQKGLVGLLPSITLIFYGLALVNGSKYTFSEIRILGLIQIVLGLLAFQYIDNSLIIWAFGFGVIQIICGLVILKKY